MMKTCTVSSVVIASLLVIVNSLRGAEARLPGGLSPDGKLEVVATEKKNVEDFEPQYEFILRSSKAKKQILKVSDAGYARSLYVAVDNEYAVSSRVLWNADSTAFAFYLRDGKHSGSTIAFALRDSGWKEIPLKDPFPQIFEESGIKEVNRSAFINPLRWEGKNTLVLESSGDCALPDRRWFEYEVKYDLFTPEKFSIKRTVLRDKNG
jgi:hypothetical protein